jgi:putative ABC transport system substrate-binding protein
VTPSLTARTRDITGVTHVAALDAQLNAIRTYRPFAKLGVLYNAAERNSVTTAEALRELAAAQGFKLVEQTFDRSVDGTVQATNIDEKIQSMKRAGADWRYLGPDTYLFSQIDRVATAAMAQRLPTFSATEAALNGKAPVLAGLVSSYYTIGQFAGYKAEQSLVKKQRARDIPIETLSRYSFIVRMDVAKRLDFLPPVSLFNYATIR